MSGRGGAADPNVWVVVTNIPPDCTPREFDHLLRRAPVLFFSLDPEQPGGARARASVRCATAEGAARLRRELHNYPMRWDAVPSRGGAARREDALRALIAPANEEFYDPEFPEYYKSAPPGR